MKLTNEKLGINSVQFFLYWKFLFNSKLFIIENETLSWFMAQFNLETNLLIISILNLSKTIIFVWLQSFFKALSICQICYKYAWAKLSQFWLNTKLFIELKLWFLHCFWEAYWKLYQNGKYDKLCLWNSKFFVAAEFR